MSSNHNWAADEWVHWYSDSASLAVLPKTDCGFQTTSQEQYDSAHIADILALCPIVWSGSSIFINVHTRSLKNHILIAICTVCVGVCLL